LQRRGEARKIWFIPAQKGYERHKEKLFKDWFDAEAAELLGRCLQFAYPGVDVDAFLMIATHERA
jgi:hypothetical protein